MGLLAVPASSHRTRTGSRLSSNPATLDTVTGRAVALGVPTAPDVPTSLRDALAGGPALFVGGWALAQLWLFIVAPLIGAAAAAGVYLGLGATTPLLTAREAEQALPVEQAERAM